MRPGRSFKKLARASGAVSYASFSGTKKEGAGVTEVSIDGVAASAENVQSGKYPFWSYEHIYTNGQPAPAIAQFIDYVSKVRISWRRPGTSASLI